MPILTARRCRHNRESCPDCGTITERRAKIATFQPVDKDGNAGVIIDGKLAGKLHNRASTYQFMHEASYPETAGWAPQTDDLKKLHGRNLGATLTVAKDHVLAFRSGQLGLHSTRPSLGDKHTAWFTLGKNA